MHKTHFFLFATLMTCQAEAQDPSYRSPSGTSFAKVVPGGTTILPNGRHLTPVGERLYTGDDLWNAVPSPDGKLIIGFCDPGIVIYPSDSTTAKSSSYRIPWRNAAFCGVFTKDGSKLITSSGDAGHGIQIFETSPWYKPATKRLEELEQEPAMTIKADDEGPMTNRTGAYTQVNFPMPKVLFDNTDFDYPAYNIARVDWFVEDLEEYRTKHDKNIPKFINVTLCNDHGAAPNAKNGFPFVASYMADNDLALGKIIAYLSSQPEWKKMAIFVTQDDSGGDNDSIDRHRSYVLCISPWAKRGNVTHEHTSIMSIIKTIYGLFDLGPNNLFDATASDLSDMFTSVPDFTPYKYVPVDARVFKPEDTFDPTDPKFERRRKEGPVVKMDDPDFVEWLRNR